MSLRLIIVSAFELKEKCHILDLSSLSIFINSETSIVKNLKPFNSVNKFITLSLIADSVSLSCSSEVKEFKISTL